METVIDIVITVVIWYLYFAAAVICVAILLGVLAQPFIWRRFFPMTPANFRWWLTRACGEVGARPGNSLSICYETGYGLAAAMKVEEFTTDGTTSWPVLVTYRDNRVHFCCRLSCPPPGLFPMAGSNPDCSWVIAEEEGGHVVTVSQSLWDRPCDWFYIGKPIFQVTQSARAIQRAVGEFQKALAS